MGDITVVNLDAQKYRASKYIQQNLTKLMAELAHSTVVSGGFNTLSQ